MVGPQRRIQMVHQRDVGRIVKRGTRRNQALGREHALGRLMALLGQEHLVRLFVHREITRLGNAFTRAGIRLTFLAHQQRHHLVHGEIGRRVVFGLAADDERVRASSIRMESTSSTMA